MDKSWMNLDDRFSPEYLKGVSEFLDFAWPKVNKRGLMLCPCLKCNNVLMRTWDDVEADLVYNGIVQSYTTWHSHGEEVVYANDEVNEECDNECDDDYGDMNEMIGDAFGQPYNNHAEGGLNDHGLDKELYKTTKKSRTYHIISHCSGSKSFVQVIHEDAIKMGEVPSRMRVLKITRTKKNETAVNENAAMIMRKMDEMRNTQDDELDIEQLTEDQTYEKLMTGCRVKCMGHNITPTSLYGDRREREYKYCEEVASLRAQLQQVENKIKESYVSHNKAILDITTQVNFLMFLVSSNGLLSGMSTLSFPPNPSSGGSNGA